MKIKNKSSMKYDIEQGSIIQHLVLNSGYFKLISMDVKKLNIDFSTLSSI